MSLTIPELQSVGIDPFTYDYPLAGHLTAALVERATPTRLTDEFLTEIAQRYVRLGRGILTATTPGAVGGSVVSERHGRA